jgi:hypothetical protein
MTGKEILDMVWAAVNSPMGVTVVASVALYLINKIYAAKPEWKKYEGTIISAVKQAEKAIPDGTANSSLSKLDVALKLVLAVYEKAYGKASPAVVASLTEGISIVHDQLEDKCTL